VPLQYVEFPTERGAMAAVLAHSALVMVEFEGGGERDDQQIIFQREKQ
jgi:hypothetical protein